MPLVTRTANQTNVYLQSAAPDNSLSGLWIDSDDGTISTNRNGSSWIQQTPGALGTANQVVAMNGAATALTYAAAAGGVFMAKKINTNIGFGVTAYCGLNESNASAYETTEARTKCAIPKALTFQNALVSTENNTANGATTVRIRRNGANSSIVITCTASTNGDFSDTTNTSAGVSGDDYNWSIAVAGSSGSWGDNCSLSVEAK